MSCASRENTRSPGGLGIDSAMTEVRPCEEVFQFCTKGRERHRLRDDVIHSGSSALLLVLRRRMPGEGNDGEMPRCGVFLTPDRSVTNIASPDDSKMRDVSSRVGNQDRLLWGAGSGMGLRGWLMRTPVSGPIR